jgi:ankyrin repeat protein
LGDQQHVNETLTADPSLVNKLSAVTSNGWYPLHWAASFGDVDMIKLLLGQYHASATVKATDGQTPLHIALQRRDRSRDVIVAFLGAGADVHAKDRAGKTPLHLAAAAHDAILIHELLNAGAEINAAGNDGNSALHLAMRPSTSAVGSEVDSITELLKGGADVNATNGLGRTPMHLAVVAERYDLMNAIINAPGIDLNIRDNDGATPISLLAGKSGADKKLVKLLLDHGAKPN